MIEVEFSSLSHLDQENVNMDSFITWFGVIHLAKTITIDLANCSFENAIIGSNPNLNYLKSDPFTYITFKRYTLDEFYGIMINIRVSKQSTAGYE